MIGFHMQRPVQGWLNAVAQLPAGTPVKAVDDFFLLRDARSANRDVRTVYRKHIWPQRASTEYAACRDIARAFLQTFLPSMMAHNMTRFVDFIEDYNEYPFTPEYLQWVVAIQDEFAEWKGRHPDQLGHVRLALFNTAVGNDIPLEAARRVRHGNAASYHGYTRFNDGVRDPLDWMYHSGRWVQMDEVWRANGIRLNWLCTEAGPYWNVYDGWRSSRVLSGDLDRYVEECVKYTIDRTAEWNRRRSGRHLGYTLFTTYTGSNSGEWWGYELGSVELNRIAAEVASYVAQPVEPPPAPQPPPIPDDIKRTLGEASVAEQIERGIPLNPNAGLQRAILADGLIPVHREITIEGRTIQAGEHGRSGNRYVYVYRVGEPVTRFRWPEL